MLDLQDFNPKPHGLRDFFKQRRQPYAGRNEVFNSFELLVLEKISAIATPDTLLSPNRQFHL